MVEGVLYKPIMDYKKCDTCGVCVGGCPAEILPELRKEEESLRGKVYRYINTTLSKDKVLEIPPCELACPIHQDVRGYIKLIAERKYEEAMELIRLTNALPSVTAYVCHHPCEGQCMRNSVEEPVSVRALKRFVVDYCGDMEPNPPRDKQKKGRKASIIGSGPAGLSAAYDLVRDGYQVEVIEALPEPGGMLRWAIPPFRLPREILNRDIRYIEKMGVKIKTGIRFGTDVTLSDIKKGGADAIIIAIGTHQGVEVGLENEKQVKGYMDCLVLLRQYASGERVDLGDKVIVVGGGNAAFDAARSARRCGNKAVVIVYRRSYKEMPVDRDEADEAKAEGVKVNYLTMPVRIIETDGRLEGLECVKTRLGKLDESGRRSPVPIKGSEFVLSATSVIAATGQQPDLSWNQEQLPFNFSSRNTFITNDNYSTNCEGIFATGDCVSGPTTVVEAMASGRKAAKSVALYLS